MVLQGFFVILDDFHRSREIPFTEGEGNLSGEFSEVLNNRFSPHLITGYSIKMLKEVFGNKVFIGISDIIELRGLAHEELVVLFENLCGLYKVKYLKAIIWTVRVVPMSAPRIIPMVCLKPISPEPTKPMSITVVALLLCNRAVIKAPMLTDLNLESVTDVSIFLSLAPATF